jgi:pimeloyl-ACP methyl ester carboxylesterase
MDRDGVNYAPEEMLMPGPVESGYAPVDGVLVYWESRGEGGTPLLLVHGGYGVTSEFDALAGQWSRDRRVIAIDLEGHGHTRASGRPFRWERFGDAVAGVITHLGLGQVDLLGYSLGGGTSLRCAIQHPERVRNLILISAPHRRDAWFPEVRAAFDGMRAGSLFEMLRHSPVYAAWQKVAPDPGSFPALIDATGELLRQPYDWSAEAAGLGMPVMLVYADADSISPAAAAELYGLLGGGQRDANWDGSLRPASRLAILPGQTHYDMLAAPALPQIVRSFTG